MLSSPVLSLTRTAIARARFDELQHYVKQHATPVGELEDDQENTVEASWPIAKYVASDGIVAMCFAWFLVS